MGGLRGSFSPATVAGQQADFSRKGGRVLLARLSIPSRQGDDVEKKRNCLLSIRPGGSQGDVFFSFLAPGFSTVSGGGLGWEGRPGAGERLLLRGPFPGKYACMVFFLMRGRMGQSGQCLDRPVFRTRVMFNFLERLYSYYKTKHTLTHIISAPPHVCVHLSPDYDQSGLAVTWLPSGLFLFRHCQP